MAQLHRAMSGIQQPPALSFVSGHDFSRAEKWLKNDGASQAAEKLDFSESAKK
jgi:hypothetical protein